MSVERLHPEVLPTKVPRAFLEGHLAVESTDLLNRQPQVSFRAVLSLRKDKRQRTR